ncbi:MAG TPA: hypothetical protein H9712_07820 [Candidatus Flavonifractor intestinigallinarum]|uniref:Uncharacterized protein n=2 Tax=Flavonifractor TaxID=946234 RepID=A0A9D2MNF5_9FIRM|nr:hypothetical protein [Candidatus Flavonifractor intestinigallinarum]
MRTIEVARRLAELGRKEDAQKGYYLALQKMKTEELEPKEQLEAASYLFFSKWDHRLPFTIFVSLYNQGYFQDELMNLMLQAFYLPNVQKQQKQYARNCRALARYSYFFRDSFPNFDELPILFFPFDDQGFVPFLQAENRFGDYVNFDDPVIDRYFFKDLENPILAKDVYSQYQLEYLNDNVRKSEWVGRENHIYLHYTDWNQFCGYLPCLDFAPLLKEKKLVFLLEEEISQYPIDFKERFGIDYSQYPVKPIGVREVNRLIWHTQLSAHNGGDFFNEIFYDHPNLLVYESIIFDSLKEQIKSCRQDWKTVNNINPWIWKELSRIPNPTDKDFLVALFLNSDAVSRDMRGDSRIAPALFFQPHFYNVCCNINLNKTQDKAIISSNQYEEISKSTIFNQFKYIKTFTPMRRITTSYGATVRFMLKGVQEKEGEKVISDAFTERLLNRSFMMDKWDRLYRDSVLVRFEDGKLNPKATFTALAEFLDIPYTESMTYCSGKTGLNPESLEGNDLGFDPAAIYRTYDEYVDDADRCLLEYFLRDVYETYGYDFHYYHGETADMEWVKEKLEGFHHLDYLIVETFKSFLDKKILENDTIIFNGTVHEKEEGNQLIAEQQLNDYKKNRLKVTEILLKGLEFVNKQGQPLHMMKKLELDPALLEQPLYH